MSNFDITYTYPDLEEVYNRKDKKEIIDFFKFKEIPLTRAEENSSAGDYIQIIHNFSLGSYNLPKAKESYICFTFIQREETFIFEVFIKENEITKHRLDLMIAYANHLKIDMYMSVSTFVKPQRKTEYVYNTNSIIIDLDIYNSEVNNTKEDPLYELMQPTFEKLGYEPSMYIHSGRGRYLVFCLENNVNLSKSSMKKLYRDTTTKLIEVFKPFGADSKCKDLTRVFHMVGNINTKTKQNYKKGIFQTPEYNKNNYYIEKDEYLQPLETMYNKVSIIGSQAIIFSNRISLTQIADSVGIKKNTKTPTNKNINYYNKKQNNYYGIKYSKVNQQRDIDLNKLLELRNYDIKGCRDYFFQICCNNSFYLGMEEQDIYNYLLSLNNKLIEPLSLNEITNILTYNKNNLALFEVNPSKAIKYSNRTIVELLDITYDEQQFMSQLIDENVLIYRKQQSSIKQNNKRLLLTKLNKELFIQELFHLRINYLMTNKEISMFKKIDVKTVLKYLGKDPKFITIGRMNNQKLVLYYTKLGYSINQISSILNISKSLVKKYRNN